MLSCFNKSYPRWNWAFHNFFFLTTDNLKTKEKISGNLYVGT